MTNPETTKRIHAQADAYAADITSEATLTEFANRMHELLRSAYLAGAEAGYLARLCEEMVKP
jgi:hypothetical protein